MSNIPILNLPVATALDGTEYIPLVQGTGGSAVTRRATSGLVGAVGLSSQLPGAIEFIIDGGGGVISARTWGFLEVPFTATLTSATLYGDQSGSIIVNVWKCTYAQFDPPTTPSSSNDITGANPPTLSAASKSTNTLTGWTTSLTDGDILAFNVPSVATSITRVTLSLQLTRVTSS